MPEGQVVCLARHSSLRPSIAWDENTGLTSQPAIGFTPALREARLNVHDSSECAGFSDSRNFGQAFKKWTDTAPGSRRTHH